MCRRTLAPVEQDRASHDSLVLIRNYAYAGSVPDAFIGPSSICIEIHIRLAFEVAVHRNQASVN